MSLQKGFLQSKLLPKISRVRFLIAAILGLFFSFSLYGIQFVAREAFRVFSLSEEGDLWIFSDTEVSFYNLIFAFIAVIFGQSISINYLFNKPSAAFKRSFTRRKDIVNEQRFLNWYFMAWYSKLALGYVAVFGFAGLGWFYLNSFYPHYNYLFILIIIVLFLQTWNSLLRTFRRKAYKWMLFSAISISLISYGMSKINIVDYQHLNQVLTNNRIDVKYELELPNTDIVDLYRTNRPTIPIISLVLPKNIDSQDTKPILLMGNQEFSFEDLPAKIIEETQKAYYFETRSNPCFLAIDKKVPMQYVHRLWEVLASSDLHYLRLIVLPKNSDLDYRYNLFYEKTSLIFFNPSHVLEFYESRVEQVKKFSSFIEIKIEEDNYVINNQIVPSEAFKAKVKEMILSDSDYGITYTYSNDISYGKYFEAHSGIKEVIFDFRDKQALRLHGVTYNELRTLSNSKDFQNEIIAKYPLRLLNISPDLKRSVSSPPKLSQ